MKKLLIILGGITLISIILVFLVLPRFYTVPILMYHYIDYSRNSITVSPENFLKQMAYLYKNNYKAISLDELVQETKAKKMFNRKSVVITFDDGYEDNYIYALPILKRYNFSAAIFLISGMVGKKGYLNWRQIKDMQGQGILFGAHATKYNTYLPDLEQDEDLIMEIEGSKIDIERQIKTKVDYFSYPIGGFNDKIKDMVKISGYKGACTTNRGRDRLNRDVFELNRIKMTNPSNNLTLWFKLSGYYNLFRSPKKPN